MCYSIKCLMSHLIGTYGYQLWFISTIIQFYLLFPLIVKLRDWMPGRIFLVAGLLICFCLGCSYFWYYTKMRTETGTVFFYVPLGVYAGHVLRRMLPENGIEFWKIRKSELIMLAIAGLALYSILAIRFGPVGRTLNDVPALFGYASLCILIYTLGIPVFNRFIMFTAKISFPIFLIHFLVLNLVETACHGLGIIPLLPPGLSLIVCYLAALPLQKFFDYFTGR